MRFASRTFGFLLALVAASAHAQLYRWVDEKGRVQYTDRPPPASAKNVETKAGGTTDAPAPRASFELEQAMKNAPVKVYSAPSCKEACDALRAALNKRGVPFKEVSVSDQASIDELQKVSGGNAVPVILVGTLLQKGFEPGALDQALDAARYPAEGVLPARNQTAPLPANTTQVDPKSAAGEAAKPAAPAPVPTGPYGLPPLPPEKKK